MKTNKTPSLPMDRNGYRVQIADAGGNPIARTRPMTLHDALSVTMEWKPIDGIVSILVPTPEDKK
jgi:hypothetical protein